MATLQRPTNTIPTLQTVALQPEFQRPVAQAYSFLKSIDSVDIRRVEVLDGVPYFVVEVYMQALHSQIPTVIQRKQLLEQQSLLAIRKHASQPTQTGRARAPTFVVKRSFAAFDEFRREVCAHLDRENRGNCCACNSWLTFMTFAMSKANLRMKLLPTKTVRKHELSKFLNTAVLLAIQATVAPARRQQCPIGDSIAESTSRFLWKDSAPY